MRRVASILVWVAVVVLVGAVELDARGRGGGMRGGGISRGGPARGGSIRHEQAGGGTRSANRGPAWEQSSRQGGWSQSRPGDSIERDGSFENRRGETIDYSGTVTRTDDGLNREGSWQSSSGASGGGSGSVSIEDGKIQGTDRSRHAETASGETIDREVQSERYGDHVYREGSIETSTGIDAETRGVIQKTDDGFRAAGVVSDGNQAWVGGVNCSGGRCYGGRATVKVKDYYYYPYYYSPYYYGWYSCPYGSVRTWNSRYGTPIYGCANVVVVHVTISLGATSASGPTNYGWPIEAQVTSAPVLMYEISSEVVVYATTTIPVDVYAVQQGERFHWVPGPAQTSPETKDWIAKSGAMSQPTANATVITYRIGPYTVYLTNERPVPGFYAETSDQLFAWIPGVREPNQEERDALATAINAQQSGGKLALEREVRKLEENHAPPPPLPAETVEAAEAPEAR